MLFRSVPVVCHPVDNRGSGLFHISVLKCIVCYLASDSCMYSSGVRLGITGLLSWIHSLPTSSLILSSSLKLHYLVLRTKTWASMTLLCCVLLKITHIWDWVVGKWRKKSAEVCPTLLGLSKAKITVLFDMVSIISQSFRQTEPLTTTTALKASATRLTWFGGGGAREQRTKTGKHGMSFHLMWGLSLSWSQN